MSLAGRIAMRGSTVTIYRPAFVTATDQSRSQSWGSGLAIGVKMVLEVLSAELAQKLFGEVGRVDVRAIVPGPQDVEAGDAIVVTAGFLSGQQYVVKRKTSFDYGTRSAHHELGLQKTAETIP